MRSYLEDDLRDVRLVASDMDYTLLADDGSMPEGMPGRIRALDVGHSEIVDHSDPAFIKMIGTMKIHA